MKWFYLTEGREVGPLTETALHELTANGVITEETPVRREDSTEWQPCAIAFSLLVKPEQQPEPAVKNQLFKFDCPHCQQNISAKAADAGLATQCPCCGEAFVVLSNKPNPNPPHAPFQSPQPAPRRGKKKRQLVILGLTTVVLLSLIAYFFTSKRKNPNQSSAVTSDNHEYSAPSDPEETFKIGLKYFEGESFSGEAVLKKDVKVKDIDKAFQNFLNAAKSGHAKSQYYLAICYIADESSHHDDDEGIRWLRKAADQGLPEAEYLLGVAYTTGEGVEKNDETGLSWIDRAAKGNDRDAQYFLGLRYINGKGIEKNEKRGAELLEQAAVKKHAEACEMLGMCYEEGIGVENNPEEAVNWYASAHLNSIQLPKEQRLGQNQPLRENDPEMQVAYGLAYYKGDKLPKSEKNAFWLFQKAAARGNPEGQYRVAMCYALGEGVEKDHAKCNEWLRKAADQGHAAAQGTLAEDYMCGLGGLKKDKLTAIRWFKKSAIGGDYKSQMWLGKLYIDGEGVPKNPRTAYTLYLLSIQKLNYLMSGQRHNISEAGLSQYDQINMDSAKAALSDTDVSEAIAMAKRLSENPSMLSTFLDTTVASERITEKKEPTADSPSSESVKSLAALQVFKSGSLDEAKECIRLLDEELKNDPENVIIKLVKSTIMDVFRAETALIAALNGQKAADKQYQIKMQNLQIASRPSPLTGRVNTSDVDRINREATEIKTSSVARINAAKADLSTSLNAAKRAIPAPDSEPLSRVWSQIESRNNL